MWVRICVWKLYLQPYVQNRKGNTIKFGREGALMPFLPPSRSYYRRRRCIYCSALISTAVGAVLDFLASCILLFPRICPF